MKKTLSVLLAGGLVFSLCSCAKNNNDIAMTSNADSSAVETLNENTDVSGAVTSEKAPDTSSDKEILKELEGFYLQKEFVDTFKTTKSQLKASQFRLAVYAGESNNGGFSAMLSDLHQGGPEYIIAESHEDNEGKHVFKATPQNTEDGGSLEIAYTPGSDVVQISADGNLMWDNCHSEGSGNDFYKYASYSDAVHNIAASVFADIASVNVTDNGVYAQFNGSEYKLELALDSVITEPIDYMENCDGYLYIYLADSEEFMIGQYAYKDGKITIASEGIDAVLD